MSSLREDAPQITIRWRRYGQGGRWRAELPPGHGIDSGWIESTSRDTVREMAAVIADRHGWTIFEEDANA